MKSIFLGLLCLLVFSSCNEWDTSLSDREVPTEDSTSINNNLNLLK